MADGYQILMDALNNYGDQTGWNTKNKLAPIDWGGSFSKWFGKKRPQLTSQQKPANQQTQDFSGVGPTDSQYSADNPYGQYMPTGKTFFAYKASPELTGLAGQWEQDKKNQDMAQAFQEAQQNDYNGQYINLDQNTINQLPENLRGLYQPGQRVLRSEVSGLITPNSKTYNYDSKSLQVFASGLDNRNPLKAVFATFGPNTPAAQIEKAMQEATNYQNYLLDYDKQGAGSDKGNIDLSRQYQGVVDAYQQYVNSVKNRRENGIVTPGTTPMSMTDWLKQPNQAGLLKTYNDFTGSNIQGFTTNFNQKPPSGTTASNTGTQQTGWFKTHSTPPAGISPNAWSDADWIVATSGGIGIQAVLKDAAQKLREGKISKDIYNALVARSRMGSSNNSALIAKN